MLATASEILRAREGALAETPLPVLLHALVVEERTAVLELKIRQLEKRIYFEDGAPVGCASNLLHETLGKYLVEKGKLSDAQFHKALSESVQLGVQLGELLVQQKLVQPFDLFKQLQANLAHKILDCFRWVDGRWRIVDGAGADSPIRMNPLQLVLTGVLSFSPFDTVATHFNFVDEQRFALLPSPPHELTDLKLTPKETRLVQALRGRPNFAELCEKTGLDTEQAMRRLFALTVLGFVGFAEEVPAGAKVEEPVAKAPPAPTPEAPAPAPPPALPFSDEDEALKNALAALYLEHRRKDPFDLLGVPVEAQPLALRKAFLALADRFSPVRFRSLDLKERAEAILLEAARAYAALVDPEQNNLHRKRRQIAAEKAKGARGPTAAEQFRIRTDLLDAGSQFQEGLKRLAEGNHRGAVEYFEYACDIEPKARYRAHLAWARFQLNPNTHARLALQELAEALRVDPSCEEALIFQGDIQKQAGDLAAAEESYRKAVKQNPGNRRYTELLKEVLQRRRR